MICTNCGKAVDEGAAFCPYCGSAMNPGGADHAPNAYMPDNNNCEETMPMMPPISEIPSTEFCLKCGKVLRSGQICNCSAYSADSYEYDDSKTEKTRVDSSALGYTASPLNPTYPVSPVRHEEPPYVRHGEPPIVRRDIPPARPASKPSSDGRGFFKTVNKL